MQSKQQGIFSLFLVVVQLANNFVGYFLNVWCYAGDEHDVFWFWQEKGKPHECPVCFQYFLVMEISWLIYTACLMYFDLDLANELR